MSFELPSDIVVMLDELHTFCSRYLEQGALERSKDQCFPRSTAQLLAEKGWVGICASTGQTGGVLPAVVALERVSRACPRTGDALHQLNFGASLLLARHGRGDRQHSLLTEILAGRALVPIAITEEGAGAQAAATQSSIRNRRLNGHKVFCANSTEADAFVVYANFGSAVADIGAVLIEREREGLRIAAPNTFMNGDNWSRLTFNDVAIGEEDVVFPAGGFVEKASFFDIEKLGNAARALGLGWCAYDLARGYALQRQQFAKPLCEFQGIQWKFAEARLQLEAAQVILYRAAARADEARLTGDESSMAKILCNRAAMGVSDMAVQVLGAAGFSSTSLAEYCFRKARGYMINGGTIELMLTRIAEGVFERKFPQQVVAS